METTTSKTKESATLTTEQLSHKIEAVKSLFKQLHTASKELKEMTHQVPMDSQLLTAYYDFLPRIVAQHKAIVTNVQEAEQQLDDIFKKLPQTWKESKKQYEAVKGAIKETDFAQHLEKTLQQLIQELNN